MEISVAQPISTQEKKLSIGQLCPYSTVREKFFAKYQGIYGSRDIFRYLWVSGFSSFPF